MLTKYLECTRSSVWRYLCVVLAATVAFQLFYLGSKPFAVGLIAAPWDKVTHFIVYAIITILLWIGTAGRMPFAVIAAVVALGALDELHQARLPGRAADIADFIVDVCAGLAACSVMHRLASAPDTRDV